MGQSDYSKYRGKCKEMSEALCAERPELTLVRGWFDCVFNGRQPHWWTTTPEGEIIDPTVKQFEGGGVCGEYIPCDGFFECANCGKKVAEEEARTEGSYAYCSYNCHGQFIGVL